MKSLSCSGLLITLLTLILFTNSSYPADPQAGSIVSSSLPTVEIIKAKIKEVEADVALKKSTKAKLAKDYRTAFNNLEMEDSNKKAANEFLNARNTATEQALAIRKKLEKAKESTPEVKLNISQNTPLAEMEQLLLLEETHLSAIEDELANAKEKMEGMVNRPAKIQERLTLVRERQNLISEEIKIPALETELPLETEARQWVLRTEEQAIRAEIERLDQELLSHPMRIDLLNAQIEEMTFEILPVEERVHKLQEKVNEQHLSQAEKTEAEAQVAQQEAMGKHPLVQKLAEQNAHLSQENALLATSLEDLTNRRDDVITEKEQLQDNFQISRQRIETIGMSQVLGRAFTEQFRTLQKFTGITEEAESLEENIAKINLTRIQYNDERLLLKNIPNYLANLTTNLSSEESDRIQDELMELADTRQKLLSQALLTQMTYLQVLNELDLANNGLLEVVKAYSEFLSKYLLWVRNESFPKLKGLQSIPDQIISLASPSNWREAFEILKFQASHSPTFIPMLVLVGIVLAGIKRLRRLLEMTGKGVGQPASDRFFATTQALGLTLLMAAPWPLLLAVFGQQLNLPESSVFTQSVSTALLKLAPVLYFLQIFRVLSIPNGFAAVHLRWSDTTLQTLRPELRWFTVIFLPAFFIGAVAIFNDFGGIGGELGRFSIMTLLIAIAILFYRLFRPLNGSLSGFLAQHPSSLLSRSHRLWFALVVALPLLLMALTFSGYIFTSAILFGRLYRTIGMIAALVILYFLAIRWVLLILSKREFLKETGNEKSEMVKATLDKESHKLISNVVTVAGIIGLWLIWSEVLPALGILNNITLWYHAEVVAGVVKNLPVTLGDACLAIIIIFLTFGGLKHFSAFLEIIIRQWSSVRPGTRYAIITLSSYAILTIATAFVFSLLGGSWKEIQWIFAALGVGIGFGLQEIVANFICGLIILFERPVRMGDIVTIGDVDGTISRIQIRATTVTTFDRKELLVPNKEFITGRLINWSLSDPITRVMVSVQVDYGSDIQKTISLMSKAAEENIRVLQSPAPFVTIEGFSENNLMLRLRCYIGLIEHRLQTITDLHRAIILKFNEEGIIIPSPQRKLRLETTQPLDIRQKQESQNRDSQDI